ncbi:hypothetical protein ACLOJK_024988 [Asimina triloba]
MHSALRHFKFPAYRAVSQSSFPKPSARQSTSHPLLKPAPPNSQMAAVFLRVPPLFLQPGVHLPIKSRQPQKPSILSLKPISIIPSRIRASRIAFKSPGQGRFLRFAANGGEATETEDVTETEIQIGPLLSPMSWRKTRCWIKGANFTSLVFLFNGTASAGCGCHYRFALSLNWVRLHKSMSFGSDVIKPHGLLPPIAEDECLLYLESAAEEEQVEDGASESSVIDAEEKPASVVMESLQLFKEAVANGDEAKVAELEAFFISIEDEKKSLESKVSALSLELSSERDKILRISADFDNFRKRTERERLSLVNNAQGEVIESLLPVLDNFERAKAQIKIETEGEGKINNSYQSIYKQFMEILSSLGVTANETVGNQFDPLKLDTPSEINNYPEKHLHEAIMQAESTEFEEGIILQEFRKGFSIGERLLRPSMVKVSSGPGPQKPEETSPPGNAENGSNESGKGSNGGGEEQGSTTERSDA